MRPNTRNSTLIAALHLALLLAAPVLGAEKGTVDGVLEKYVKAIGGKEAWNKVESRSIKADFEGPNGATSGWSLQAKAPNKRLTRMESSPWGVLLDGFDGTTAWSKNQNGVRTKDGDQLSYAEKEADLRREVRLKELYAGITDQYLLGPSILVAPVQEKGATRRVIEFPPGVWKGDDGSTVSGPCRVEVAAPLSRLPWYRKG